MNRSQRPAFFLASAYRLLVRTGVTTSRWFHPCYAALYSLYKRYYEDPYFHLIRKHPQLFRGGHILDIGANVGYTVRLFADVVETPFKVFAFEPDALNFRRLTLNLKNHPKVTQLELLEQAVGSEEGECHLWINQHNPSDHRVLTSCFADAFAEKPATRYIPITTIDSFAESRQIAADISFIKIDVQGFELAVCAGMSKTLAINERVHVSLEFVPKQMRELGFEPKELLQFFDDRNFTFFRISQRGELVRTNSRALEQFFDSERYLELLCARASLGVSV